MKKGQITLIIIIAIVLIEIILVFFAFKSKTTFKEKTIAPEIQPIYN